MMLVKYSFLTEYILSFTGAGGGGEGSTHNGHLTSPVTQDVPSANHGALSEGGEPHNGDRSPNDNKSPQFSPTSKRANRHRDSIASAPGLSSGISLVGILKNGSGERTSTQGEGNRVNFVTSHSTDCIQLPLTTTTMQPLGVHRTNKNKSPLAMSPLSPVEPQWPLVPNNERRYSGGGRKNRTSPTKSPPLLPRKHELSDTGSSNHSNLAQSDSFIHGNGSEDDKSLLEVSGTKVLSDDSGHDSPKGWQSRGMSSSTSGSGSGSLPPATPTPVPPTSLSPFRMDSTGDMQAAIQLQEFTESMSNPTSPCNQDRSLATTLTTSPTNQDCSLPNNLTSTNQSANSRTMGEGPLLASPSSPSNPLLTNTNMVSSMTTSGDVLSNGDTDSLSETDSQASHTPFLSTDL